MKKYIIGEIIENKEISENIFNLVLSFDEKPDKPIAGQFSQIFLNNKSMLLPRPISICDYNMMKNTIRYVYQKVGKGTKELSTYKNGEKLKVITNLGNGFKVIKTGEEVTLIGGGVGVPPMLMLAKEMRNFNKDIIINAFLGFRSKTYLVDEFKEYSENVFIATDDGNVGFKGNVLQLISEMKYNPKEIYCCGPLPMLKGVAAKYNETITCYFSMEERMACGIGVCVGCAVKVYNENRNDFVYKKVCLDGPVFNGKELYFE